jgi:hypothetical protein
VLVLYAKPTGKHVRQAEVMIHKTSCFCMFLPKTEFGRALSSNKHISYPDYVCLFKFGRNNYGSHNIRFFVFVVTVNTL